MKKLLIAIGCIAAIVQMSSCTSDSVQETKNTTNKTTPEIISAEVLDSIPAPNSIEPDNGDTDPGKTKT
ncbi:MAG TPA: hypothetical protein VF842_09345 [Flavobacterium sp.]